MRCLSALVVYALLAIGLAGCMSPYHADKGALLGGLGGAGVGALVGNAVGSPAAGAAIGAGVGALSGAAIGNAMDEVEARNRAMIAAQLGRQVPPGALTINDVVGMVRGGVSEELIVAHVSYHGMAAPLQPNDLVFLKQQGVSDRVVQAMYTPARQPMVAAAQPPVVVPYAYPAPYYYDPWEPRWSIYYGHPHHYRPASVSWGVRVCN